MRLAFIMPGDGERQKIDRMRESVIEMRSDQLRYLESLLRSWRIFGRSDAIGATWRAIKRTLRECP